ncbi:MAG: YihY/virulence factor BrkB family protein [bacterium]|nr:YihY/virulence factor BrkB family protein [bacterium]
MIDRLRLFFEETLWRLDLTKMTPMRRFFFHPLRFIFLVCRAFLSDVCSLHASALTYITLLAIVPVLALAMTSLRAFGGGEFLESHILNRIEVAAEQEYIVESQATAVDESNAHLEPLVQESSEHAKNVSQSVRRLLGSVVEQINKINFKALGTIGAVCLLFMVINVLGKIEESFNAIWGIPKPRSIWRKITDYLCVIIIVPVLALSASSLPILGTFQNYFSHAGWLMEALGFLRFVIPLAIFSCLFAFIFCFMPNARVRFTSAFVGGFITVILLQAFFKLCLWFQIGISSNSSIYGSLVALPILLFWINWSWQIILFGAEICYVFQYRHELVRESAFSHPSERDTITLAIALTLCAADSIDRDSHPVEVEKFSNLFMLPSREVHRVAALLGRAKILLPVTDGQSSIPTGFVLSRCATRLTVADVINACLDNTKGEKLAINTSSTTIGPYASIERLRDEFSEMLNNRFSMTIMDALVYQRSRAKQEPPIDQEGTNQASCESNSKTAKDDVEGAIKA